MYNCSVPGSRGQTNVTGLCNPWTKSKCVLFLYYTHHSMNFHSCIKQIFKSFGCTKIRNDSKWTKTSRNEVMQPTTSNNDSLPIFPYHVHNQTGFDDRFINGRGFIYLGISKISISIKAARKANIWLHAHYCR